MEFSELTITKEVQKQMKALYSEDLLHDLEAQEMFVPFFRQKKLVDVQGDRNFKCNGLLSSEGNNRYRIEWRTGCSRPVEENEFFYIIFDRNPNKHRTFIRVREITETAIVFTQADRRMSLRIGLDLKCNVTVIPEEFFHSFLKNTRTIVRRVNKKMSSQTKDKLISQDYVLNGEIREDPNLYIVGDSSAATLLNVSYGGCKLAIPDKFADTARNAKFVYVPMRIPLNRHTRFLGAFAFPRAVGNDENGWFMSCSFVLPFAKGVFL